MEIENILESVLQEGIVRLRMQHTSKPKTFFEGTGETHIERTCAIYDYDNSALSIAAYPEDSVTYDERDAMMFDLELDEYPSNLVKKPEIDPLGNNRHRHRQWLNPAISAVHQGGERVGVKNSSDCTGGAKRLDLLTVAAIEEDSKPVVPLNSNLLKLSERLKNAIERFKTGRNSEHFSEAFDRIVDHFNIQVEIIQNFTAAIVSSSENRSLMTGDFGGADLESKVSKVEESAIRQNLNLKEELFTDCIEGIQGLIIASEEFSPQRSTTIHKPKTFLSFPRKRLKDSREILSSNTLLNPADDDVNISNTKVDLDICIEEDFENVSLHLPLKKRSKQSEEENLSYVGDENEMSNINRLFPVFAKQLQQRSSSKPSSPPVQPPVQAQAKSNPPIEEDFEKISLHLPLKKRFKQSEEENLSHVGDEKKASLPPQAQAKTNPPIESNKISEEAKRIMTSWFNEHYSRPNPNSDQIAELASKCGIKEKQVGNWFINRRNRTWREELNKSVSTKQGCLDLIANAKEQYSATSTPVVPQAALKQKQKEKTTKK